MPIYDYKCKDCGEVFEKLSTHGQRNEPRTCFRCGGVAKLQISAPKSVHGGFYDSVTRPRSGS